MRFATANGIFLVLPQAVGFTIYPRLAVEPHPPAAGAPHSPLSEAAATRSCSHDLPLRQPHHRQQRRARESPRLGPLKVATTAQTTGLSCATRKQQRRQQPHLPSNSRSGTTVKQRGTMSLTATSTTTTTGAAEISVSSASGAGAEDTAVVNPSQGEGILGGGGLRCAIVGVGADAVGLRLGQRFGGVVITSIDKLMKGRKGRKTEKVKANAVSKWLTEEGGVGGILTGFPTTPPEAEALQKAGVSFESLVVLEPPGTGRSEAMDNLMELYSGKISQVPYHEDVETLSDQTAGLLGLAEPQNASIVETGVAGTANARVSQERTADSGGAGTEMSLKSTSPWEHSMGKKRGPVARETAVQAAKTGAELKRARKQSIKEKKRAANEAQRLDTPFYLAVAEGKPKAKHRAPVPTIPSRITERLDSAVVEDDTDANTQLEFGPLVLDSPASDCLLASGITKPTGIQAEGMGPIVDGESVVLHAMTGSGKTLAFLLPLMQRWAPSLFGDRKGAESSSDGAFRLLLALPTRELAVQVAREVVLLAGGVTAPVELLVDSGVHHDLGKVTAPIVVGSAKILERVIRKSRPTVRDDVLSRVECIVVDEVDRLVDVLPKHTPPREVERRKRHARPIASLLKRVIEARPFVQIVACSATIGRPLRRELAHIVRSAFAVAAEVDPAAAKAVEDGEQRGDLRVIRDLSAQSPDEALASERAVPIPGGIRHYCVPLQNGEFFTRLEALTAAIRELQPRRPLVFVPPQERVTAVVAHLRRAGGDIGPNAMALHEAMGFASGLYGGDDDDDDGEMEGGRGGNADRVRVGGVRGKHSSEAILQHDKLTGQLSASSRSRSSSVEAETGAGEAVGDDLLLGAESGLKRLGEGDTGAILVTGEDSARGLHFDDVDFVFLMQRPKNPDEYVHLAGRTGRQGKEGNVVTLVTVEEFRKMRAWSTSLKVYYEKMDVLASQ